MGKTCVLMSTNHVLDHPETVHPFPNIETIVHNRQVYIYYWYLLFFKGRFAIIKESYNYQRLQATKDNEAETCVLINFEVSLK